MVTTGDRENVAFGEPLSDPELLIVDVEELRAASVVVAETTDDAEYDEFTVCVCCTLVRADAVIDLLTLGEAVGVPGAMERVAFIDADDEETPEELGPTDCVVTLTVADARVDTVAEPVEVLEESADTRADAEATSD